MTKIMCKKSDKLGFVVKDRGSVTRLWSVGLGLVCELGLVVG